MTAEEYFGDWMKFIDMREIRKALSEVSKMGPPYLCPQYSDIFKAFRVCPYKECKVIFLSQDPYPQKGIATGIAFGNKEGTESLSPSLEVLKEACINYEMPHGTIEFDATLESWSRQGVLLLNSALTCEANKPGSHIMIWRSFISKFLKKFSEYNTGIIYLLLGQRAKTFKPYIGKDNDIIEVEHPAYFARTNQIMPYSIFTDINKLLKGRYNTTIEWYKELNNLNTTNNDRQRIFDVSGFYWPDSL